MLKNSKIIIFLTLAILIPFLSYLYITNRCVATQIKTNNDLRDKIVALDKFKVDVIDMSLANKSYIITQKNNYKKSFEENLNNAFFDLENLYDSNYILNEDRTSLKSKLNEYNELSKNSANASINSKNQMNSDTEKNLLELTELETSIIENASKSSYKSMENTKSNAGTALDLVDNQNNILQVIGGFITMIFLSPIYFINKNSNLVLDTIKKFLSNNFSKDKNITSPNEKITEPECNNLMIKCINDGILKNLEEKLSERELMLSSLRIIYSHSEFMEKEWENGKEALNSIENDLLEIQIELSKLMKKSDIPYKKLNVIENKLLEVKFLLEKLPKYHEFIMKLTERF